MGWLRAAAVAVVVIALAACASTPLIGEPAPLPGASTDLRGVWAGTWGGAPAKLLVIEQHDLQPYSGLFFGPLMVLGHAEPGISGTLSYTVRGTLTSVRVVGWVGGSPRSPVLRLHAESVDGIVQAVLRQVDPTRFIGTGDSSFTWGPSGPIELTR
jgi:hypothetical protein